MGLGRRPTAASAASPLAISSEPTQNFTLSEQQISDAFDDAEPPDPGDAQIDADWQQELFDAEDAVVSEEVAGAELALDDDHEAAAAEPEYNDPSTRFDVSDAVLEEMSLPKHLAATAAAASFQPLVEPLFDNQPTQHVSEDLVAALRKRSPSTSAKVVANPSSKTPATVAGVQPALAPRQDVAKPQSASALAATIVQAQPAVKQAAAAGSTQAKAAAHPRDSGAKTTAEPRAAAASRTPKPAANAKPIETPAPAAAVRPQLDSKVLSHRDAASASRPGPRDATLIDLGSDRAPVVAQKSVANNPTILAMAPIVPKPSAGAAAASSTAPTPAASPLAKASEPISTAPAKAPLTRSSPVTAGKPMAPVAIPVPTSLLKKDAAPLRPAADAAASDGRGSAHVHSGATFVLPPAKEPARPTSAPQPGHTPAEKPVALRGPEVGGGHGGGGRSQGKDPGGGEPPREALRQGVEQRVSQRARDFSLPALLDVLEMLDYRPDEIEFGSVLSYSHPSSLIQSVQFFTEPRRRVHIALNMGLLSAQSPLPSYILKYAEHMEGDALIDFLGFFDHHLLRRRAASLYPERDRTLFADWPETQAQLLQLVGLTAPSTLYWLFQRVYPELGIEVRRSTERKALSAEGVVLGNAKLGEACAFGGGTSVPVGGLEVTLYSEEENTPTGIAWPVEASQRLREQIFSALGLTDVYLTVHLIILEQTSWLSIEDDRYLGFEPLWEDMRGDLSLLAQSASTAGPSHSRAAAQAREAALRARSRSAVRMHQVQLFSGSIRSGSVGTEAEPQSAIA